jgi:hypothetical protein
MIYGEWVNGWDYALTVLRYETPWPGYIDKPDTSMVAYYRVLDSKSMRYHYMNQKEADAYYVHAYEGLRGLIWRQFWW